LYASEQNEWEHCVCCFVTVMQEPLQIITVVDFESQEWLLTPANAQSLKNAAHCATTSIMKWCIDDFKDTWNAIGNYSVHCSCLSECSKAIAVDSIWFFRPIIQRSIITIFRFYSSEIHCYSQILFCSDARIPVAKAIWIMGWISSDVLFFLQFIESLKHVVHFNVIDANLVSLFAEICTFVAVIYRLVIIHFLHFISQFHCYNMSISWVNCVIYLE